MGDKSETRESRRKKLEALRASSSNLEEKSRIYYSRRNSIDAAFLAAAVILVRRTVCARTLVPPRSFYAQCSIDSEKKRSRPLERRQSQFPAFKVAGCAAHCHRPTWNRFCTRCIAFNVAPCLLRVICQGERAILTALLSYLTTTLIYYPQPFRSVFEAYRSSGYIKAARFIFRVE